jgi:hypothetical protein
MKPVVPVPPVVPFVGVEVGFEVGVVVGAGVVSLLAGTGVGVVVFCAKHATVKIQRQTSTRLRTFMRKVSL